MKNINEILELISKIVLLLSTIVTLLKLYFDYTTKNKRTDLSKRDIESCNFLSDPLKEFYNEEEARDLFYSITGISASSKQQVLIIELRSKLGDRFSWPQLEMASKYFKYDNVVISICVKHKEILRARLLLIMSIILALLSFLLVCSSLLYSKTTIQSSISYFAIGIISIIYIAFFTHRFIAPVNIAQKIMNQLKQIESEHDE